MFDYTPIFQNILKDVLAFANQATGIKLRSYQAAAARAIIDSVVKRRGLSFVVMFPRQSGKNELQAQIESYLLLLYSTTDGEIVKVSPTWKPQSLNAMRRLDRTLRRNFATQDRFAKEGGYIYRVGLDGVCARIYFLSGAPVAQIVGATANVLLEVDEAQEVSIEKFDKEIAPMAAARNCTRVFYGTAWTSQTLLGRELRLARQAEENDGIRRAFVVDAGAVGQEVPAYRKFVAGQVARLGRQHPLVKTQFFGEEIDAEGGMFPPARRALMQGRHPHQPEPQPGSIYALTIDLAGEDESALDSADLRGGRLENPRRDLTALTVFEIDLASLDDALVQRPTYRAVNRFAWRGVRHSSLYGQLRALIEAWSPRYVVVDATGVGAGLASFLETAYPGLLLPFVFNQASKSRLGWEFLAAVETGRYKEHAPDPGQPLQKDFWRQVEACQYSILEGPGKVMRWGVPDGSRDPASGELIHDDLLISAALCAVLEEQTFGLAKSRVINRKDILSTLAF